MSHILASRVLQQLTLRNLLYKMIAEGIFMISTAKVARRIDRCCAVF